MSKSFPLKPLLELSQTRMDDAARRLGELIASEQEGTRKLELLQNYRDEYESRFHEAARNGISPDEWRNFSAFIGRIDEAIAVQKANVERSRQMTVAGQNAWMAQRNKVKAFDTLQKRHDLGEARKEARLEQRQSDEHSAKRYANREDGGES
ncbi:MAG: flagellar protein FliJ [Azoarcus sp.]|uniref:Flagellar FliJ protein n=1 Tax=Aromatoleum tolulyticum TaxID=34027 RepID=A0A1N7CBP5_9RHOO|nr:flagellar export protein FliJ [Aromatoleum tolulyticum]MCK9985093.1 flagellar protein FliJ [Azoarcus sp.]SIR61038.1 flagellar FliJ protein [Aromatoleum tolulyticum]